MMVRPGEFGPGALQGFRTGDLRHLKARGHLTDELACIEPRHAADQAVRRQDLQPRRMHVHERHHDAVRAGQVGILVAESQRSFIAVMPVGDEQFLVRHQLPDARNTAGVRDLPKRMARAVLVGDIAGGLRLRGFVQQTVDLTRRVGVQHEELAEVRVRVAQQFQPVLLRAGQGLLVPVDDARRILLHRAQSDEALAHQPFAAIGHGELLEVGNSASSASRARTPCAVQSFR